MLVSILSLAECSFFTCDKLYRMHFSKNSMLCVSGPTYLAWVLLIVSIILTGGSGSLSQRNCRGKARN